MLSIALDNASNNDAMVKALSKLDNSFLGAASHVRCFAHIINLVAKTVLYQFDTTRKGDDVDADASNIDKAAALLGDLVAGLDLEDVGDVDEEGGDDDDVDG